MGGVGHSSASRRAGEMERMRLFVGSSEVVVLVSVFVSVSAGAQVVRWGRRREDINVRIAAMLREWRRCILK